MAKKRKSVSVRARFEVFKRDSFTCQYCGRTPPAVILELDHIVPVASGGDNSELNLLTSCWDCNRGKADRHLEQVPVSLQEQIAEKRERAAQIKEYNQFLTKLRDAETLSIKRIAWYWLSKYRDDPSLWTFADARMASIRTFLKSLPEAELLDAVDLAWSRKEPATEVQRDATWKYFCGICWSKIKGGK